ncbi:septation ring formation regulator EzrA [Lysinibacillus sp. FSL R7-0073]|uniref:Septation ring formation regulator EzrA n=1 Tax=Lysinibacillus fusiformis TaxID=28031 RepID=A0A1E4RAG9_9BACI|nr:septation ring formation regulator EzrA [Lysinibacillus fusiformis]MBD8522498.1 septation ring formation regulator EzrA [Lysinibacillus fusiformis]MCR8852744.1 septation ring formation regulator EzrA [Lysinibacillus fusiformis]MED4888633.1 septation ring formation regulator EzrA [Lysinibacillus fusiformis]ODV57467.1 selenide, water dikinase [Lysinibacillus fusiformis]WKT75780.1 septation ring formation regulator EzrA [Lysinibacillus fusiformis]
MEYIIIPIILLLILAIVGFMMRRKHVAIIAKLENEKLQIQHKPINEEISKVKSLNMNGETEEMFERWRNIWDEVIDVHMTKIDSLLFDAEDQINRLRFKKATLIEREIEDYIEKCDQDKDKILEELNELIGSEEKNRIEIEQLKEYYRSARKTLLAHQHSFGVALPALEKKLEEFVEKFEKFDVLTNEGNYLQAREIVISLNQESQQTFEYINDVPTILTELQVKLPGAVQELRNGQREMEDQSYYLQHLELAEALNNYEKEFASLKNDLAELNLMVVKPRVTEINEEIDHFYDLLEKEVIAKNYVDQNCDRLLSSITNVITSTKSVSDEANYVQQSYHLNEKDAEIPKAALKQLEALQRRYDLLAMRVKEEKSAYSSLQEELIEISEELERIHEEQGHLSNTMKKLRIDENKARAQVENLKKILQDTDRLLNKANIPGVPEEMDARLDEAAEHIYVVMQSLQEVPLNMGTVHNNLNAATLCVEDVKAKAHELIENVMLIERIIQYGNRHRASNPTLNTRLKEAEEAFHQFRYSKALEEAGTAVEEMEPGALKRIQEMVAEQSMTKN